MIPRLVLPVLSLLFCFVLAASVSDLQSTLLSSLSSSSLSSPALEVLLARALSTLRNKPLYANETVAVIGGGLSGLTSALYLLENGVNVVLLDRSAFLGGNSAKASSGINGAYTTYQSDLNVDDSLESFAQDTLKSSERERDSETGRLIDAMVGDSKSAVEWILDRADVPKDKVLVGQLGGHSGKRTHRPATGLSGAAFINGLEKAVNKYKNTGQLVVKTDARVTKLEREEEEQSSSSSSSDLWRLTVLNESTNDVHTLIVRSVIICTGGYAYPSDDPASLLAKVAPQLTHLASTNNPTTTGDGIVLATSVGGATVDMEMIQVHPTGFVDEPTGFKQVSKEKRSLILCAEIVRGAGGVLLDMHGSRFIDELETRKTVTEAMNNAALVGTQPYYVVAVPPTAAGDVTTHINIYEGKGLLHKVEGVAGVEAFIKKRINFGVEREMKTRDTFKDTTEGGGVFRRTPTSLPFDGTYYVGVVTPVLHYTMGGLKTSPDGQVLDEEDKPISGLYAAGEVMGGVHGENRLGGSSLLDCVVFGMRAAKAAQKTVKSTAEAGVQNLGAFVTGGGGGNTVGGSKGGERKRVKIAGKTYDLTDFLDIHPGGPIDVYDGEDLTSRFVHAHGTDYSLLDRSSIQVIDDKGQVVKREKKFYEDYGTEGGSWREFIGRRAWFVLHSFAAKYPNSPSEADKRAILGLITAFGQLYPCKLCRGHLQQQLRDSALGPPRVESREALSVWMCELHNIVNADLGKAQVPCNAFGIDTMYLKDCGECEVKRPEPTGEELEVPAIFEKGGVGGYDSYYAGTWDANIYRRGDGLLNSVTDSTDAWEAESLAELVDAMDVLRKWFRTFKPEEIEGLREEMRKGKQAREEATNVLLELMREPLQGIKKGSLKQYEKAKVKK